MQKRFEDQALTAKAVRKKLARLAVPLERLPEKTETLWLVMDKAWPETRLLNKPRLDFAGPDEIHIALCRQPPLIWYRYLYNAVGGPWHWWIRNRMTDEQLSSVIHHNRVHVYVLYIGGAPAGFFEIDFRKHPQEVTLAYFGLTPEFIGYGLGEWFLGQALQTAWRRFGAAEKVVLNTCSLDHPVAMKLYLRFGFRVVKREALDTPAREIFLNYATLNRHLMPADDTT